MIDVTTKADRVHWLPPQRHRGCRHLSRGAQLRYATKQSPDLSMNLCAETLRMSVVPALVGLPEEEREFDLEARVGGAARR